MKRLHLVLVLALSLSACGRREAAKEPAHEATPPSPPKVTAPAPAPAPTSAGLPDRVDPKAHYLFYLHGKIVEDEGIAATHPKFGKYEYENILAAFREKGFVIISEVRPRGTDVRQYADKLASQVKTLLDRGASPRRITLVGASKGGAIVALASSLIRNKDVNVVILADCFKPMMDEHAVDLWGRILSIYDASDTLGGSCRPLVEKSTGVSTFKEIVLTVDLGHGMLYKPMKEWVDPAVEWALKD